MLLLSKRESFNLIHTHTLGKTPFSRDYILRSTLMSEDYFLCFEELDWATRAKGLYSLAYAPNSIVYHKEGASIGSNRERKDKSLPITTP